MFHNTKTIEIGVSDFHKMTVTVLMKTYFIKGPLKIISYRDYKTFSHVRFRRELEKAVLRPNIFQISNNVFVEICMEIFSKLAALKFKYVRANQSPFMTSNREIIVQISHFNQEMLRTVTYGTDTLSFVGPKMWSIDPQ